jgi:hypothetical protein
MADEYRIELERQGISIETNYNIGHNVIVKADVKSLKELYQYIRKLN